MEYTGTDQPCVEGQFGKEDDTLDKYYNEGETIHYFIEEKRPEEEIDSPKIKNNDELNQRMINAVEHLFPFTQNSKGKTMKCPNWAKALLFRYNTLEDVERIIKFFNKGGECEKE